jgi:hypothetical protein
MTGCIDSWDGRSPNRAARPIALETSMTESSAWFLKLSNPCELMVVKKAGGRIWLRAKSGGSPKLASPCEAELIAEIERLHDFISTVDTHPRV